MEEFIDSALDLNNIGCYFHKEVEDKTGDNQVQKLINKLHSDITNVREIITEHLGLATLHRVIDMNMSWWWSCYLNAQHMHPERKLGDSLHSTLKATWDMTQPNHPTYCCPRKGCGKWFIGKYSAFYHICNYFLKMNACV